MTETAPVYEFVGTARPIHRGSDIPPGNVRSIRIFATDLETAHDKAESALGQLRPGYVWSVYFSEMKEVQP